MPHPQECLSRQTPYSTGASDGQMPGFVLPPPRVDVVVLIHLMNALPLPRRSHWLLIRDGDKIVFSR